ncbi:MAG: hypothetical protein OSA23_17180 [Rhodospirillales bacterium]|nr:hypothetical protein [Rhodospirillales bacterium]
MKKSDDIDSAGNPICVVTYSSGLTENSIAFDGRCADYSDDEIQAVLDGQEYRPLPMPSSDLLDYYFQNVAQADTPDFCKEVLVEAEVLEGSGSLTRVVESTFDKVHLDKFKTEAGNNWIIAAVAFYVFRNFQTYSLQFYAASALYETYVLKRPFRAGYITAEMIWRFEHETSALLGQKNKKALQAAEDAKPIRAKLKREQKLDRVAKIWHEQAVELGNNAMRKDSNAAHAIYVKALKGRYPELLVKKSSKVIGPDSIKRLLPELRERDKIG